MINKAKKYLKNVDKEVGQTLRAGDVAVKARRNANIVKVPIVRLGKETKSKTVKYGLSEKEANKKVKSERGQLLGAVLQGRRYNENGKIVKKSSATSAPKIAVKKTSPKKK